MAILFYMFKAIILFLDDMIRMPDNLSNKNTTLHG